MTNYEEKGFAPFLLAFCALEFIISHKKINFVIVIRRESPETKGIHCLSVTLNSGKINCRGRTLNRP